MRRLHSCQPGCWSSETAGEGERGRRETGGERGRGEGGGGRGEGGGGGMIGEGNGRERGKERDSWGDRKGKRE